MRGTIKTNKVATPKNTAAGSSVAAPKSQAPAPSLFGGLFGASDTAPAAKPAARGTEVKKATVKKAMPPPQKKVAPPPKKKAAVPSAPEAKDAPKGDGLLFGFFAPAPSQTAAAPSPAQTKPAVTQKKTLPPTTQQTPKPTPRPTPKPAPPVSKKAPVTAKKPVTPPLKKPLLPPQARKTMTPAPAAPKAARDDGDNFFSRLSGTIKMSTKAISDAAPKPKPAAPKPKPVPTFKPTTPPTSPPKPKPKVPVTTITDNVSSGFGNLFSSAKGTIKGTIKKLAPSAPAASDLLSAPREKENLIPLPEPDDVDAPLYDPAKDFGRYKLVDVETLKRKDEELREAKARAVQKDNQLATLVAQTKNQEQELSQLREQVAALSKSAAEAAQVSTEQQELEEYIVPPQCKGSLSLLQEAAEDRDVDPEEVYTAIRTLEKSKLQVPAIAVKGTWKLVFTTGTSQSQSQFGKINYVPFKAVQSFADDGTISNGIFLGPVPLIQFKGRYKWLPFRSRLEFDFEDVEAFGLYTPDNIPPPVRNILGLKVDGQEYKKQPAFNFIAVDDKVLVGRGAGGGVALWVREEDV
eukprot:CAMPEP_0184481610 /NCGR_PEP_ID=MMETSP0113_2-20130426/3163_1 /TAXON_ID=91329 /ORGANISM="Norrisiella sphaerica, Strain BC52" /LENGTH=576 /DNA_ID=CAMNT_0026860829 /DNA_START=808 /DNA_END=2538 /DNA_ORIENTATION=-